MPGSIIETLVTTLLSHTVKKRWEFPRTKIQSLMLVKDKCLPRPKKAGPPELFSWFFETVELLSTSKGVMKTIEYCKMVRSQSPVGDQPGVVSVTISQPLKFACLCAMSSVMPYPAERLNDWPDLLGTD